MKISDDTFSIAMAGVEHVGINKTLNDCIVQDPHFVELITFGVGEMGIKAESIKGIEWIKLEDAEFVFKQIMLMYRLCVRLEDAHRKIMGETCG